MSESHNNSGKNRVSGSSQAGPSTVRQTIVANLEAPKLKGISTKNFITFLRLREAYERDVDEKNKEPGVQLTPTSYKASVDRTQLKTFITAGWVKADKLEDITEEQIKECIKKRAVREASGAELSRIEAAISNVRINMKITEPEDRIWNLALHYETVLENAGYTDLPEKKPTTAITHILKRIKPNALKKRMYDIVKFEKDDVDGKNKSMDFKTFMRELAAQAVKMDGELLGSAPDPMDISDDSDSDAKPSYRHRKKYAGTSSGYSGKNQPKDGKCNKGTSKRKRDEHESPPCLNKEKCPHSRHYMSECPNSTDEEKKKLLKDFRMDKKRQRKSEGNVKALVVDPTRDRSTLFSGSFLNDAVETIIMADQGSDCNLLGPETLNAIQSSDSSVQTTKLDPPVSFNGVGKGATINCNKKVTLDVQLRVRHGTRLILRNVDWFVSEQSITNCLLGRPLLDAIGCSNRTMIQAACDKHDGEINVADIMDETTPEVGTDDAEMSIAALLSGDIFHSAGGVEDDGMDDEDIYIDMGEDPPFEIEKELEKRIKDAGQNGLTGKGIERLRSLISKFKHIFRLRLGKGKPAKVPPMKIDLDTSKSPVKAKVRRYPHEQRKFLNKYVEKLVEMGFFIPNPKASWQAAPHLVVKHNSKAKFRTTIDLRPVNGATKKNQWPMPNIEAELQDFSNSRCFASMDFCSSYWQLPLDPESYDACGVICPQGTYSSTRVLHGLTNAVSHFQSSVEPLFAELRPNVKGWIDDFNLHDETEDSLLDKVEKFLYICDKHDLILSAKKCVFFKKEIKWCGRIIDGDGYRLDPRNIEALKNIHAPQTAGELCEYIHCCRWMSTAIPDFARRSGPLDELLEKAYKKVGKRTKRAIKNVKLHSLGWNQEHTQLFEDIQLNLKMQLS